MALTIHHLDAGDPLLEREAYPLLLALRPRLSLEAFRALIGADAGRGVRVLAACEPETHCLGAALYRVLVTSRGRVIFLDDIVTEPGSRSRGVGAALLEEVERIGREAQCERLELDSGVTNLGAHRFYYRHHLGVLALHFSKDLSPKAGTSATAEAS